MLEFLRVVGHGPAVLTLRNRPGIQNRTAFGGPKQEYQALAEMTEIYTFQVKCNNHFGADQVFFITQVYNNIKENTQQSIIYVCVVYLLLTTNTVLN